MGSNTNNSHNSKVLKALVSNMKNEERNNKIFKYEY